MPWPNEGSGGHPAICITTSHPHLVCSHALDTRTHLHAHDTRAQVHIHVHAIARALTRKPHTHALEVQVQGDEVLEHGVSQRLQALAVGTVVGAARGHARQHVIHRRQTVVRMYGRVQVAGTGAHG